VVFWLDLDTRWGLTSLMRKGPSQNVIARHIPRSGRGERVAKVVIVAHYDSARASLASSPGMVKNRAAAFALMKVCTFAVPVLVAARLLPFASRLEPWAWYATLVPAAYLLVPLLIDVHSELFMKYTPGANDNASGVAALLGLIDRLVPESDTLQPLTRDAHITHGEKEAREADVVPEGSLLSYSPVAAPARPVESWTDDDISWDTGVITGQTSLGLDSYAHALKAKEQEAVSTAPDPEAERAARLFGAAPTVPHKQPAPQPDLEFDIELDGVPLRSTGPSLSDDTVPFTPVESADAAGQHDEKPRRGLFGGARKEPTGERHGVRDWLGIDKDFDARKKGTSIGSWDNFSDEDDDDSSGWKGGSAGAESVDDPDFAASIAARIRRRVTMNVDRELTEKEIWFVATGAEEVGTFGMRAFLAEHGPDLHDAAIINLDNIGAGSLSYVTREGMARRYDSDRRLLSAARRAVREADLAVKGHEYRGLSTDATPALARGYHAMSVMAFDVNGRIPNWHWTTDTIDDVNEANIETAVEFVTALIKEL